MGLTKKKLDSARYQGDGRSWDIRYDGSVPGFGVRVFASGVKSFVLRYRTLTGRTRILTLGRYGTLTIEQGRAKARKELVRVSDGADPVSERKAERTASTVREMAELYLERHAKPRKKTWREDKRRLDTYILPALGSRKLSDVRRADVARLHSVIGREKPYEANRVLALVSALFAKGEEWGSLSEGSPNPAKKVQPFEEKSRDRFIKPDEMPALAAAIDAEGSAYTRTAFKLYLLTGLRRSELLGLRWNDVDMKARELRLGETKAGRPHILPLSEPVVELLRALPRMVGNPFVFPGHVRGHALVNVAKPWRRIRARLWLAMNTEEAETLGRQAAAEVKARKGERKHASARNEMVEARLLSLAEEKVVVAHDAIRLHDLRRTVGSWLAMGGASLPLIGKVLNHSNPSTTQVYARLAEDAPRAALEELAARMVASGVRAG